MKIVLIIILIIFVVCGVYFILGYNKLIKLNNQIKEAFATMDIFLKKRWDLIPNIIETVKGYAKHEKDTFSEIVNLRNGNYESLSYEEKIKTNKRLTKEINRIMAVVEAYPELKSNENFLNLQNSLKDIEDEISQSRKYYNALIKNYNNFVETIPSNIVAKILGYSSKDMFEINEEERQNIKVEF